MMCKYGMVFSVDGFLAILMWTPTGLNLLSIDGRGYFGTTNYNGHSVEYLINEESKYSPNIKYLGFATIDVKIQSDPQETRYVRLENE